MRGTVAKKIRRGVYGEHSLRGKRAYKFDPKVGGLVNEGRRFYYQRLKEAVKQGILKI